MRNPKHIQLELFRLAPRDEGKAKVDWSKGGIKSLSLKRYKRFKDFYIDFDRISLLVGANSSGKTSILQAIRLFFWCINVCLRKQSDGYRLAKAVIPFSDFHLIPAHALRELSYNGISPNKRTLGIELLGTLENGLSLSFRIYSSYSTLMVVDPENQPDEPISEEKISYIDRSPLYIPGFFGVVTRELLAHDARLEELLNSGHHNEVLRNIILRLKGDNSRLTRLLHIIEKEFKIHHIDIPFSEKTTEFLRAEYSEPHVRIPLDFVSAGSGFLQVLQIVAHAFQNPSPIILLDEPDAHMHHSLQRSFLRFLREFANKEDLQIVMASHSETFLRETPLNEIRIIDANWSQAGKFPSVTELQEQLQCAGIWPSRVELTEMLRVRRVLLVEGKEDEEMLNQLGRLMYDDWDSSIRSLQIIYSDGSSDITVQRLEYIQEILSRILHDGINIAHMRDRDLLCDAAVDALREEAKQKHLPLYISNVRNRETILIQPNLIERVVNIYFKDKLPPSLANKGVIEDLVRSEIMSWCLYQIDELPIKIQDYNRAWVRKSFEGDELRHGERLVTNFIRVAWQEPINRNQIPWKLVDGKTLLRQIRRKFQEYNLTLPDDLIFSVMTIDDYDECMKETIKTVYSWLKDEKPN